MALAKTVALEVEDANITVNVQLPAVIDTPATRKALPYSDYVKWPTPDEIAAVAEYLLSGDSVVISGAAIPVYGRPSRIRPALSQGCRFVTGREDRVALATGGADMATQTLTHRSKTLLLAFLLLLGAAIIAGSQQPAGAGGGQSRYSSKVRAREPVSARSVDARCRSMAVWMQETR